MLLNPAHRPAWSRYLVAVVAVALGAAVRAALLETLGTRALFITFYPAVMLAALGGGLPGGLLATALSALTANFFWVEPVGQFFNRDPADWLAAGVFVISGSMISLVTQAMQHAQARAGQAEAQVKLAQERSRAEEELRRYKLLAEHSRDVILYLRRDDGRILEANAAAANVYGYTRDELQSLTIHELRVAGADAHSLTEGQMAEADASGILFEAVHRRKDGSTFPVEVSSQGATIGGTRTLVSVIRDITRRARAEEELRQQREWLRVTLASIGDAVVATGSDGRIAFLNPVAAALTGWNEREALGQPIQAVFRIVNEETHEPAEAIGKRVQRGGVVLSLANHAALVARDGREISVEGSAAPIPDAGGGVAGVVVVFHEVTEKRREQEALRAERERLRLALDASSSGIWEWDLGTNENFWSEELWKLYGLEPHSCTPSYETWRQVVIPEDRPAAELAVQEAARNGAELNVEFRVRGRGGAERWLMSRAQPQRDADGQIVRYIGIVLDISARKRAEEALRESEGKYRLLFQNSLDGILLISPDGRILSANSEACRILGRTEEEIVLEGRDGIADTADPRLKAALEERKRTGRFRGELVYKRKDGTKIPVELSSVAYQAKEGGTLSSVFFRDITERKSAEREREGFIEHLAAERELLNTVLSATPVGINLVRGSDLTYEWVNPAYQSFAPGKEMLGRSLQDVWPEIYPRLSELYRQVLETGETYQEVDREFHIRRSPDGPLEPRRFTWTLVRARLSGEQGWGVLNTVIETTERVLAEARLRQAQKAESLGVLAGGVAHDFNNLLVAVIGNASLAQEMLPSGNPAVKLLQRILEAGEALAQLTRQMLAYSGKGQFLVEPLNLSKLLPEMTSLAQRSIPKKVPLHLELDHHLPLVEADRGQLQQIILNLVVNAAEAIGSSEGLISVKAGIQDLDDQYVRNHPEAAELSFGEYVWLEVSDSGCGMDEATKAKIFDPFFSTKFVGRGLGLAAVAGIVRSHKGTVTVSSAPGKGSSFKVLLPASGRAPVAAPVHEARGALLGSGTILVVDDEEGVRTVTKTVLEWSGYQVLVAESGTAAIDTLKRHTGEIAAVILDLSMPVMSGTETLLELRKIRPEIKILITSGYSEAETMRQFQGQRVSGFVQKPYTPRGIAEKVKACLG